MIKSKADPFRVVEFGTGKTLLNSVPTALFLLFLGLSVLAFLDVRGNRGAIAAGILIVVGCAWIGYALYRKKYPAKPMLTLNTQGIQFRMVALKEFFIPWAEVQAVVIHDIRTLYPSPKVTRFVVFRDVTAVRIPKTFYDQHIHVDSLIMRGPGWKTNFIEEGDYVDVALHHELFAVGPEEMRDAVLTRWRRFGRLHNSPAVIISPAVAARRTRWQLFRLPEMPASLASKFSTGLTLVLVAGILFALSNLLGFWQADYQRDARAKQQEWRSQQEKWKLEDQRSRDEQRKKDAEWDEFWKRNRL